MRARPMARTATRTWPRSQAIAGARERPQCRIALDTSGGSSLSRGYDFPRCRCARSAGARRNSTDQCGGRDSLQSDRRSPWHGADRAWLANRLVTGLSREHGMAAGLCALHRLRQPGSTERRENTLGDFAPTMAGSGWTGLSAHRRRTLCRRSARNSRRMDARKPARIHGELVMCDGSGAAHFHLDVVLPRLCAEPRLG